MRTVFGQILHDFMLLMLLSYREGPAGTRSFRQPQLDARHIAIHGSHQQRVRSKLARVSMPELIRDMQQRHHHGSHDQIIMCALWKRMMQNARDHQVGCMSIKASTINAIEIVGQAVIRFNTAPAMSLCPQGRGRSDRLH